MQTLLKSMSRTRTPTENGVMGAINGWAKDELIIDLNINKSESVLK